MSTSQLRRPRKEVHLKRMTLARGVTPERATLSDYRERYEHMKERVRQGPVRSRPDVAAHLFEDPSTGRYHAVGRKRGTGLLLVQRELGDMGWREAKRALSGVLSQTQEIAARQREARR